MQVNRPMNCFSKRKNINLGNKEPFNIIHKLHDFYNYDEVYLNEKKH